MSVLLEFAMFSLDGKESKSDDVVKIINMLKQSKVPYKLTPMGTVVETNTIKEALALVEKSHDILDSSRIYSTIKVDSKEGRVDGLNSKVRSVEEKLG